MYGTGLHLGLSVYTCMGVFRSRQGSIFWLPDHSFEHQLMIEPTGSFILELVQEACFPTPYGRPP